MSADDLDDIKEGLRAEPKTEPINWRKGLSTGSTLLNLACSGRPNVGMIPGHFYWVIGDSESGKSWIALSSLAEASINKSYDKHRLIYDNAEDGALMDLERYFGKALMDRLEPPSCDKGTPVYSTTVEDFYYHLDDVQHGKEPFVYVLDSMDALDSEADQDQFEKEKKAARKGNSKEVKGSYGTSKARINSQGLRRVCSLLSGTDNILIIISQTRANIGRDAMFNPKTVSGGKALKFFSTWAIWTAVKGQVKKTIKGEDAKRAVNLGIEVQIKFAKNRLTGQKHKVDFPILWALGIDDVGSMVEWMTEEDFWKKSGNNIVAETLGLKGTRDGLIMQIEERGLENDLKMVVTEAWSSIVNASQLHRKKRYE